eukprot:SAG11_NODE_33795_length_275_cov_0.869318_1_plen_59_part_01
MLLCVAQALGALYGRGALRTRDKGESAATVRSIHAFLGFRAGEKHRFGSCTVLVPHTII